jgi:membrane protease YdiL (CAAX protease family)
MIPEEPTERLPFSPGFAVILAVGAVFLETLILVFLATATGGVTPAQHGIATLVGFGAMFALGAQRLPPPPAEALGFVSPRPRSWWVMLLFIPSLLLISEVDNVFTAMYPKPEELLPNGESLWGLPFVELALVGVLVMPLVDELFFRGLLQPRLVEGFGRRLGVLATAALVGLTGLALGGPWAFVYGATSGLVLGALRETTGSLVPGLVLAVVFGVFGMLAQQQAFGIPGFDDLSADHTPVVLLIPAALLFGWGLRMGQRQIVS